MPERRYDVRVTGRLSDVAQAALAAADVAEVAAETVISGLVRDDQGLHQGTASDEQQRPVPLGSTRWSASRPARYVRDRG